MSWRIEEADALVLLRELPDRWAQTCVARPPRGGDPERTLEILAEVRRVLRDDGTLWVLLQREQLPLAGELCEEGWTQRPAPEWAERATRDAHGEAARLFLLTTQRQYFFFDAHTIAARPGASSALCVSASRQARRLQTCIPAREHSAGWRSSSAASWPALRCWRVGRAARPTSAPGPARTLSESGVPRARTTTPAGAVSCSTPSMTGPASRPPRRRSTPDAASSGSPSPQKRVSADDGVAHIAARPADRRVRARRRDGDRDRAAARAAAILLALSRPSNGPRPTPQRHPGPSVARRTPSVVAQATESSTAPLTPLVARTAALFLAGYLGYIYGHAAASEIAGATPPLLRSLRAQPTRISPGMRARRPHVLALHGAPAGWVRSG